MKILLLAGEESGAIYARQIRERLVGHEVRGFGDYGFKTEDLAVMGVDEVLKSIFYLLRVKRTMERAIDEWKPDVVCTIDYPGMNFKLAAYAKNRGIRTIHVVCPQVWAWKAGRIPKIQRIFDELCCFLPFEPKLFRPGFAEFVGHPLVEAFEADRRRFETSRKEQDGSSILLAMLPGSRLGEINKHLPTMLEAVRGRNGLRVVIPAANDRAYMAIEQIVEKNGRKCVGADWLLHIQRGGARELLMQADCAVVASGTATLEAALANCPTVLVYKAAPLFAFVARHVIKGIRFIGLANIIWDKSMVAIGKEPPVADAPMPELLQENLTVGNLKRLLDPLLDDANLRSAFRTRLTNAMHLLQSNDDAIGKITEKIVNPVSI